MIVRHPALIVRCAGVDDVVVALRFAREHDLLTSVKGGGHNVTGYAVCADSLMLDLSAMRGARVPEHRGHVFAGDLVQHPQRSDRTLQLPEVIESSFDSTSCRACGRNRKVWNAS